MKYVVKQGQIFRLKAPIACTAQKVRFFFFKISKKLFVTACLPLRLDHYNHDNHGHNMTDII